MKRVDSAGAPRVVSFHLSLMPLPSACGPLLVDIRLQEEELAVIRRRQATFARERDAEMAEVQRMEAEAKRKSAEK